MNPLAIEKQNPLYNAKSFYSINGWLLFGSICVIYIFSSWWLQTQVLTDDLYYQTLGGKVSESKIDSFIGLQHRTRMLGYALIPVGLLFKMAATSFCLMAGLLISSYKLSLRTLFKIVLVAESAFIAAALLRVVLLAFFHTIDRLEDFQAFAPLSLYSLINSSSLPTWLVYPLQTLNLFEVAYCLLLAVGLHYFLHKPLGKMLLLTTCSYGLGLICWMAALVFLNLNLTT